MLRYRMHEVRALEPIRQQVKRPSLLHSACKDEPSPQALSSWPYVTASQCSALTSQAQHSSTGLERTGRESDAAQVKSDLVLTYIQASRTKTRKEGMNDFHIRGKLTAIRRQDSEY